MPAVSRRLSRTAISLILLLPIAWGLRLSLLEGFVYAWSRAFSGDFAAAMYQHHIWDGSGIFYGPLFVMERWLTTRWPEVFSIFTFALINVLLAGVAIGCCLYACRANLRQAMLIVAAWLAFNRFSYAFAVAANPEFLELAFLSVAWASASRGGEVVQGASTAVAALTKLIPTIFLIAPAVRRQWHSLIAFAATYLLVVVLVGYGQGMGPVRTVLETIFPVHSSVRRSLALPVDSTELLGLNSALGRLVIGSWDRKAPELVNSSLWMIQGATVLVLLALLMACGWASHALHRSAAISPRSGVALTYALLFGLMPLATLNAHQHTFIFLLPTFAALIAVLAQDEPNRTRGALFGAAFLACYVYLGLPGAFLLADRMFHSSLVKWWQGAEAIWGNLALMGLMLGYVLARCGRRSS